MVSSDFGKLGVQRHFSSGIDCAMAGFGKLDAAAAIPAPAPTTPPRTFLRLAIDHVSLKVPNRSACELSSPPGLTTGGGHHPCPASRRRERRLERPDGAGSNPSSPVAAPFIKC